MKQTPMEDIVILVSSLRTVAAASIPFVFTDRHAYLATAEFFNDLERLDRIDWGILQNRDFKRNPENPGKFERYQAEALIHHHLPVAALAGIACQGSAQQNCLQIQLQRLGLTLDVVVRSGWYF